jgi:rubrerythrin
MTDTITLREVLEGAIAKEIEACTLYQGLSEAMQDPAAGNAFCLLSEQEKGHRLLLEKYLNGELKEDALSHTSFIDYHIAEHLRQPGISPEMPLKDVFLLAAEREKNAHDFYLALAGIHPEGKVRALLEDLAAQEMGHKHRVENLYSEVAFPQTDGG